MLFYLFNQRNVFWQIFAFCFFPYYLVCTCRWCDRRLFNAQAFRLRWLWMLNVCFYQVICMYPRSLSSLPDRLDSDCSPGVTLPASRPSSEQCRTSLPCLVLKHVKSANVFCPYQFTLLLFNAFSHASPMTVCCACVQPHSQCSAAGNELKFCIRHAVFLCMHKLC